jgi:hypothetical protein
VATPDRADPGFTEPVLDVPIRAVVGGLAALRLVQAVAASGIAVLAFATAHGHPSRLARREQLAVVLPIVGLTLLALTGR